MRRAIPRHVVTSSRTRPSHKGNYLPSVHFNAQRLGSLQSSRGFRCLHALNRTLPSFSSFWTPEQAEERERYKSYAEQSPPPLAPHEEDYWLEPAEEEEQDVFTTRLLQAQAAAAARRKEMEGERLVDKENWFPRTRGNPGRYEDYYAHLSDVVAFARAEAGCSLFEPTTKEQGMLDDYVVATMQGEHFTPDVTMTQAGYIAHMYSLQYVGVETSSDQYASNTASASTAGIAYVASKGDNGFGAVCTLSTRSSLTSEESAILRSEITMSDPDHAYSSWHSWSSKMLTISLQHNRMYSQAIRRNTRYVLPACAIDSFHLLRFQSTSRSEIHAAWENLDPKNRSKHWVLAMLHLLWHNHDFVLTALGATKDTNRPVRVVSDIITYLAQRFATRKDRERLQADKSTVECVDELLDVFSTVPNRWRMPQRHTFAASIMAMATESQVKRLYLLGWNKTRETGWNKETLLQFGHRLGKFGDRELALRLLRAAAASGASPKSKRFAQVAAAILRGSIRREDGYASNLQLIDEFSKLGLAANVYLYNILIANAIEVGEYADAVKVFSVMESTGIIPNLVTYSTMLLGCKDPIELQRWVERAQNCEVIDARLATTWLIIELQRLGRREDISPTEKWQAMAHLYARYFEQKPLDLLLESQGPWLPNYDPANSHVLQGSHRMQPISDTLIVMIMAHLRFCCAPPRSIAQLWENYRGLVWGASSPRDLRNLFVGTFVTDLLANAFIHAARPHEQLLRWSTEIIGRMIRPGHSTAYIADGTNGETGSNKDGRSIKSAKPTVFTWTSLMMAYSHHGRTEGVSKIMKIMKQNKVAPTTVTWNTLISAQARQQNIHGIVDSLAEMTNSGFEMNEGTSKALGLLRNVHELRSLLREHEVMMDVDPFLTKRFPKREDAQR